MGRHPQVMPPIGFALRVQHWQQQHGRHHLPWQHTRDPYRIWLAEIMLQQTQVSAVIDYYQRFLQRFPHITALAHATQDEVMPYWAGLGYYARARNLHHCAQLIARDWNGHFPSNAASIMTLPGIGRSTAAAIAAFAYGERSPIMDGNVRRVFCRYFGIQGAAGHAATERLLWKTAEQLLRDAPQSLDMAAYTQGLMDLGATVCTRTQTACNICPLSHDCYAHQHSLQRVLPTAKPKKRIPERHCLMLVWHCQGQVLLQQRPSPGIWGGLWSLPQYEDASALLADCHLRGVDAAQAQPMKSMQHIFTHFKLHIQPRWLDISHQAGVLTRATERWQSLDGLDKVALPAPVHKLLCGIASATQWGRHPGS